MERVNNVIKGKQQLAQKEQQEQQKPQGQQVAQNEHNAKSMLHTPKLSKDSIRLLL